LFKFLRPISDISGCNARTNLREALFTRSPDLSIQIQ